MTRSKYNNTKCELDGFKFDSKKERDYYAALKLREKAGEVSGIEVHPKYEIRVCMNKICSMIPDFRFWDAKQGLCRVVDTKGVITDVFRIKKKLLWATQQVDVEVI